MATWKLIYIMISMVIIGLHVGTLMLDEDYEHTVTKVFDIMFWVVVISLLGINLLIK